MGSSAIASLKGSVKQANELNIRAANQYENIVAATLSLGEPWWASAQAQPP
ncbi:MAG: hypothetical protein V8T45_07290 [Oscillospiraceae bacterium]